MPRAGVQGTTNKGFYINMCYPCSHISVISCKILYPLCISSSSFVLDAFPPSRCPLQGKPLSHATFHRFGWPESIAESSVERWVQQMLQLTAQQDQLQKKGAVAGPAKSKPAGSGRRGSDSGGSSSEEEEEDGEPCEVCGRRYPHQHVKAVYRSGYNDASDED